ncbi:MAG: SDR family NAD(P)-dependent oxidoreductase, partial [Alphaproteobacteria bacterium]
MDDGTGARCRAARPGGGGLSLTRRRPSSRTWDSPAFAGPRRRGRDMSGTAIVTGGSRGIGAAVARLLGGRGWSVAVNYRSNAAEAQAVAQDVDAAGGRGLPVQ